MSLHDNSKENKLKRAKKIIGFYGNGTITVKFDNGRNEKLVDFEYEISNEKINYNDVTENVMIWLDIKFTNEDVHRKNLQVLYYHIDDETYYALNVRLIDQIRKIFDNFNLYIKVWVAKINEDTLHT